jgi:cell division topological specificity factor
LGGLLQRFLGREDSSRTVAKDRLRLVLIHDRVDMAPEILEALQKDMLAVISTYMDIDPDGFRVEVERQDAGTTLVANIPIRAVKRQA